jgi:hypothetical protein
VALMRHWWSDRARWHQATVVLGVIAVAAISGAAVGWVMGGDSANGPATSSEAATTNPVLITPAERPAPPAGSGRLRVREWESATSAIVGVNREVDHYTEELASRCSELLQAVEVAQALACFDDAYAGVEDRVVASVDQLDALRADAGPRCAKALGYAYTVLNGSLFRALRSSRQALDSVDSPAITPSAALRLQSHRWDHASTAMRQLCAPA